MRILITGGTGLLAVNWATVLRQQHEVWLGTHRRAVQLRGVRAIGLDLGSAAALGRTLAKMRPDVLVHTAGIASVDACERAPEDAMAANAGLAAVAAEAAAQNAVRLVHISTDHLFAGERALYTEDDPPQPVNAYARSKLEAERRVAAICPAALIVRTNFFGWGHAFRQSLSDWVLEGLRAGAPRRMFTDAFFTPILAARLAHAVLGLLAAGASGILHVGGGERLSKHAFGLRLARAFGLPAASVLPARLAEARLGAPRPPDMSLSSARAYAILGTAPAPLDEQLAELRAQEETGLSRELRHAVTESLHVHS